MAVAAGVQQADARRAGLAQLDTESSSLLHQLFGLPEARAATSWNSFLKLMRDMGFTPTAITVSSVRFDPPDPTDVSVTFHKPHPDPTIHPMMLREFGKKLKKNYPWLTATLPPLLTAQAPAEPHPRAEANRAAFARLEFDGAHAPAARHVGQDGRYVLGLLMRDMGFTYDPGIVGPSVRFNPPNTNDVSITFHKPHPDPTIHQMMLGMFRDRLVRNYGWCEADFP